MKHLRPALLTILLSLGLAHAEPESIPDVDPSVNIASTSTQVEGSRLLGSPITRVDLDIGELVLRDGALEGSYRVNVDANSVPAPLRGIARGKNEAGHITLPVKVPFSELVASGGTLKGYGYCQEKDKSRIIICEVIPNNTDKQSGTIKLSIDTGNRVMDFVSKYVVNAEMQLALNY